MKTFYTILAAMLLLTALPTGAQTSKPCVSCLPQGIIFTTQGQIDSFSINYPNCAKIEGSIKISGNSISNLSGLLVLNEIGGDVLIGEYYGNYTNPMLSTLNGLENLTIIAGSFSISNNGTLYSLSGLGGITTIFGCLSIVDNPELLTIQGLDTLDHIGDCLAIEENSNLLTLSGLDAVSYIGSGIFIRYNNSLVNMTGLQNLMNAMDKVWICNNPSLVHLDGLTSLNSIQEELYIIENFSLIDLYGLNALTSVGDAFNLYGNYNLASLEGLNNLTSIGRSLVIGNNPKLDDLTALSNLLNLGMGSLIVSENDSLTSLSGLDNIWSGSILNLEISNNLLLSTCHVASICNYLAAPNGSISINGNAPGCYNQQQVTDSCTLMIVDPVFSDSGMGFYPNPTSGKIFIHTPVKGWISILDLHGREVLLQETNEPKTTIDVSGLNEGMYFLRLTGDNSVCVGKFIKIL